MGQLNGVVEAEKAVLANMTPRAQYMDRLERYVLGTQYKGRPSFWTEGKPIVERAPCITYKIVKSAIASNVDLVLGEGRFPHITTNPGEDDEDFDDALLSDDESALADRFIEELQRQVRFRAACRSALGDAQACGTSVAIIGARAGKLFIDSVKAKWCERELDDAGAVTKLTILYPYKVTEKRRDGTYEVVAKLYKRVIDTESDITFLPINARADGTEVDKSEWKPDPAKTFSHGLGFCPVVWYAFMLGCATVEEIDGQAIHALSLDEIEAHDIALSQRHRAAVYCGDPQLVEYGVDMGSSPARKGRAPVVPATRLGGPATTQNPVVAEFTQQGKPTRRKGVSEVWQYEMPDSKAEYLQIGADALKAIDENAADIRQKIAEALCVVFLDPENVKFAATVSGKALETIRERQLNRCDQIRDDFGDGFIIPVISMLLRMVLHLSASGATLRLAGVDKVKPMLQKVADSSDPGHWYAPTMVLKWGDYFKPDAADEQVIVNMAIAAKDGGVITRETAVERVRRIFGIENVEEYVKTLEEEAEEHMALEAEMAEIAGVASGKPAGRKPGKKARGAASSSGSKSA